MNKTDLLKAINEKLADKWDKKAVTIETFPQLVDDITSLSISLTLEAALEAIPPEANQITNPTANGPFEVYAINNFRSQTIERLNKLKEL